MPLVEMKGFGMRLEKKTVLSGGAFRAALRVLLVVGVGAAAVAPAWAQTTRTWVSGVGDDVNPCSRTAPCKTFAGAISKTAAGGEINLIDSGGFGGVTITKSITIDGGGALGSVLVSGTKGINIIAGKDDDVVLRNIAIRGVGGTRGTSGVKFTGGRSLRLQNVHIENFSEAALEVNVPLGAKVEVLGSVFSHSDQGIWVTDNAATARTTVSVQRSSIVFNKKSGGTGATADPATEGAGLWADGAGARILLSNSTVFGNGIGVVGTRSGEIATYGTNATQGNVRNGSFTATVSNN